MSRGMCLYFRVQGWWDAADARRIVWKAWFREPGLMLTTARFRRQMKSKVGLALFNLFPLWFRLQDVRKKKRASFKALTRGVRGMKIFWWSDFQGAEPFAKAFDEAFPVRPKGSGCCDAVDCTEPLAIKLVAQKFSGSDQWSWRHAFHEDAGDALVGCRFGCWSSDRHDRISAHNLKLFFDPDEVSDVRRTLRLGNALLKSKRFRLEECNIRDRFVFLHVGESDTESAEKSILSLPTLEKWKALHRPKNKPAKAATKVLPPMEGVLLVKAELSTPFSEALTRFLGFLKPPKGFSPRTDFHCTLLYARSRCRLPYLIRAYDPPLQARISGVSRFGEAVALELDAPQILARRQQVLAEAFAATDLRAHDEKPLRASPEQAGVFRPHTTIGFLPETNDRREDEAQRAFMVELAAAVKEQLSLLEFCGENGKTLDEEAVVIPW